MSLPLLPLVLHNVPPGLAQALAQEGVPHVVFAETNSEPCGRFVLFDSRLASTPRLRAGQQAIDIANCDQASSDPSAASLTNQLIDRTSVRQRWQFGELQPEERVAAVDKCAVRRTLMERLRQQIETAGGVWMTLAACPAEYSSAFCLRVDYDEVAPEDVSQFLDAIQGFEQATSHYLCSSAYRRQTEVHARLRGLHVGGHGYWHHTYADAAENLRNIGRGLDVLRRAGLEPDGFVAPHGRFNLGLLHSLESLGVSHSSEFALAYDDRPFFPLDGSSRPSSVMQIPVHPISLGVLLEAAAGANQSTSAAVDAATTHFAAWLESHWRAGEPTILYGHPERRLGRYPQLVRELFRTAATLRGLWLTNLREYRAWWLARSTVRVQVDRGPAGLRIRRLSRAQAWTPALEIWQRDKVARVTLDVPEVIVDRRCLLSSEREQQLATSTSEAFLYSAFSGRKIVRPQFAQRPEPPSLSGTPVPRTFSLRSTLKKFVDWERDTPTAELRVRNVRQLLKKSLRYAFPLAD